MFKLAKKKNQANTGNSILLSRTWSHHSTSQVLEIREQTPPDTSIPSTCYGNGSGAAMEKEEFLAACSRAFQGFPGQSMPSSWAGPVANSSSLSFMTSLPPSDQSSRVPDVTDFLSKPVLFLLLPKSFAVWEQQIENVACIYRRHITGLESLL